jgi:Domain of unknown function (DUF4262)
MFWKWRRSSPKRRNRRLRRAGAIMLTALDARADALDSHEQDFVAQIREHGWFRTNVFADEERPGFSYTTGFWLTTGFPEIIVFSLKTETAHSILWDLFREVHSGKIPAIGRAVSDIFGNTNAALIPCAKKHYRDYLGWSRWFYAGDEFDCLQLVWPDKAGIFPWQPNFDEDFRNAQPDLTEAGWVAALAQ